MYQLRPYQQEAVDATLNHFRRSDDPAVIVLPTGAGKSLVIAELARLARRHILVLTHVQELVEQNHAKYEAFGLKAGIYAAGLKRKESEFQVTFASVQSLARGLEHFDGDYSLLIIDECHRVSTDENSQYQQIIAHLKKTNPKLKVLGLTATPYRLGYGWIYRTHYRGFVRESESRLFERCIYELPLNYLISRGYLTRPEIVDAAIAHYDFDALPHTASGEIREADLNALLRQCPRVTEAICQQIVELGSQRQGVMIFASTVKHAREILGYLPAEESALIIGNTPAAERTQLIQSFKRKELRYLVNVAVLTTGFDAPHVDMIAILRPTASVSLFQQIVGRGLRLAEDKKDCLVIDYAGNGYNLYYPEVGSPKPNPDTEPVQVFCPACGFANIFWGRTDGDGHVIEHYGRRCQGLLEPPEDEPEARAQQCDFRFKFKSCPQCGAENDIAARECHQCHCALIDPDDILRRALNLKDAKVIRCAGISFSHQHERLRITYHDEDGLELSESFDFAKAGQRKVFNQLFGRRFEQGAAPRQFQHAADVVAAESLFSAPDFVVARAHGKHFRIQERLFDYKGNYRKANEMR